MKTRKVPKYQFLKMVELRCIKVNKMDFADHILYNIKSLAEYIDYGCKFVNNKCQMVKKLKGLNKCQVSTIFENGCCCGGCEKSFGYLRKIHWEYLGDYAKAWNKETGFFEIGKGCQLPHSLRSETCIGYRCNTIKDTKELSKLESNLLSFIKNHTS